MKDKIALVTGGSRGLGKDMALSLAKKGIDVIPTYYSKKGDAGNVVDAIKQLGQKALALPFDAGDIKSLGTFIQQVSASLKSTWKSDRLDFLVNNAGMGASVPFKQISTMGQPG